MLQKRCQTLPNLGILQVAYFQRVMGYIVGNGLTHSYIYWFILSGTGGFQPLAIEAFGEYPGH